MVHDIEEHNRRAGMVLLHAVTIESYIENCIGGYFKMKDHNKQKDIQDILILPLNFDKKKSILLRLCDNVGIQFDSNVSSDIAFIQRLRNKVAHGELAVDMLKKIKIQKRESLKLPEDEIELNEDTMKRYMEAVQRGIPYLGRLWIELESKERKGSVL